MRRTLHRCVATMLVVAAGAFCAQSQQPESSQDHNARIQAALAASQAPPDTLISLQRGACEGPCPVYRLIVFADGTVLYQGEYHVRRTGLVKSSIAPETLLKLLGDIDASGFFQLNSGSSGGNSSHCDTLETGRPLVTLMVSSRGRAKTLLHNHNCRAAVSDRMSALEDKIDQAAQSGQWVK